MSDDVTIEKWRQGYDEPIVYLKTITDAALVIERLRVFIQRGEFNLTIWFEDAK